MELDGFFIDGERALFAPDNILVGLDEYIEDTIGDVEAQTKTITGRMVTIDDAAGYKKVAAITVEPKNLIKYTSDWDRFVTLERNGVLFTMDYDYGLTLSGQATGYNNTEYVLSTTALPAGNYVLTGGVSEKIYLQATVGGTDLAQEIGNGVNFVVNDGDTFRLKLCILPGTFCNDGDYKQRVLPMVRAANIIADDNYYEPPAVDFVEICQAGKNLLDVTLTNKNVANGITVIPNEDGSFTVYGTNTNRAYDSVNQVWNDAPLSIPLGKFEGKNNFSYILSGCPSGANVMLKASGNVSINTISGTSVAAHTTTSYVYTDTGAESNPIIFPSGINRYDVSLEIAAGAENVDTVVWPMIRLNNPAVDSSFEKSRRIDYIFKSTGNIFADTDVHPFASETNFWSKHGSVSITYYTPSTTSLSEALEEVARKLPIVEPMPPHPGVTNEFHILPYDRHGTDALRLLSYNRDGSVGVVTMPNVHTLVNTDIYDACHILTIVNTYLKEAANFVYGNPGTPQFEGDFRNPTLQTPAKNGSNQFYIDCAMFAQLVGHGILYEDSFYAHSGDSGYENKAMHPMFDQLGEAVKPYWLTSTTEPDHKRLGNSYTTMNRMTSYALAKYFYDCGKFKPVQDVDDIPVGALVFSGSSAARFKGIGHVFIVVSRIGSGRSNVLIAEATGGVSDDQAIIVRPLPASYTIQGYVIPPCTGDLARVRFGGLYASTNGGQMALRNTGVSLASTVTYAHQSGKMASFVIAICPESNTAYNLTVSLVPTESGTPNSGISNALVTSETTGPYVVHIPYGYTLKLKSTTNTTFTVHRMHLLTDREITVPLVPMN